MVSTINAMEGSKLQPITMGQSSSTARETESSVSAPVVQQTRSSNDSQAADRVQSSVATAPQHSESVKIAVNFTAMHTEKEQSNEVATTVRQLEFARANIDEMRSKLTQIVKMYPPYPKDSDERAMLLNEVSGMRELIAQLTIPPPYDVMVRQVSDTPSLGDVNASDASVAESLKSLDAASAVIAAESQRLFSQGNVGGSGGIDAGQEAQQQSQKIGAELASIGSGVSSEAGKSLAVTLTR